MNLRDFRYLVALADERQRRCLAEIHDTGSGDLRNGEHDTHGDKRGVETMTARISTVITTLALLAIAAGAAAADGPTVSQAWARATAPGVDVGAAYLTIDGGAADDNLVSASTARATMVHLHTVEESGGVAKMRAVEGIEVPAGKRVVLAPKGTHIMLMGLAKPLVAGETFPVELRFAKAGTVGVTVLVRPVGSDAPPPAPR